MQNSLVSSSIYASCLGILHAGVPMKATIAVHCIINLFKKKKFGGHKSFLWGHWYPCFGLLAKNIERGRNSSCYIALCAKSVGNLTPAVASHNTVTERQLFGFGNLWFYTFKKGLYLEKYYLIYLRKIIQQFIHKMWKKNQHYFTAKPMEAVCWIPTDSAWPQLLLATHILLL